MLAQVITCVHQSLMETKFDNYFIDAQHLGKAILNTSDDLLRGHMVVMVDEILDYDKIIYTISKLNSVGQKRKLTEYLRSWVYKGNKSYIYLAELMRKNPHYSINSLVECLSGKKCTGNEDFKTGRLNFTKEQKDKATKLISFHKKLMKTGLRYSTNSFAALVRFNIDNGEVSNDRIYDKVKKSTKDFEEIKGRDLFITTLKIHCSNEL